MLHSVIEMHEGRHSEFPAMPINFVVKGDWSEMRRPLSFFLFVWHDVIASLLSSRNPRA